MDLFVLDTLGNQKLLQESTENNNDQNYYIKSSKQIQAKVVELEHDSESEEDDGDYGGLAPPSKDLSRIINKTLEKFNKSNKKTNKNTLDVDSFVESMGWNDQNKVKSKKRFQYPELNTVTGKIDGDLGQTDVQKEIENSQMKAIEKVNQINCYSEHQLKKLRKDERSKTKGPQWFNMPATEVTEEIENDLKILQMRSALDPKRFYKKNDLRVLPKYFQIGTIQHSPLDYYQERHIRKNKKRTIVDELMADADFKKFTKRKYKEVIEKKQKTGLHKALKKMKKLKKKK